MEGVTDQDEMYDQLNSAPSGFHPDLSRTNQDRMTVCKLFTSPERHLDQHIRDPDFCRGSPTKNFEANIPGFGGDSFSRTSSALRASVRVLIITAPLLNYDKI